MDNYKIKSIFKLFGLSLDIFTYGRLSEIGYGKQLELSFSGIWIFTISKTAMSFNLTDKCYKLEYNRGIWKNVDGVFAWVKQWG